MPVNNGKSACDLLTDSTTFDFLCHHTNDGQYLHHNVHANIRHNNRRWHVGVNLETTEKVFYPTEQIKESTVACVDVFNRLKIVHVKVDRKVI